jgi:hypothetical protein
VRMMPPQIRTTSGVRQFDVGIARESRGKRAF